MSNAALADLPEIENRKPPNARANNDTAPDVIAMPAKAPVGKSRRRWPIMVLVLAGVAGAAGWHWHTQLAVLIGASDGATAENGGSRFGGKASLGLAPAGTQNAEKPMSKIRTATVEVKPRYDVLKLTGTLMADERSSVASNTSGIAAEVRVDRGSVVKKNDVLVQIDPTDAKNKLAEGQAMLDELKARLGLDGDMSNFNPEDEPEVRVAKASAELAAANLARAKENIAKKVISKEAYDQFETEYELASQRYRQSLFQIKQAFQVCRTAQIRLEILKKAVDDTTIRAPFDGWVAERLVSVGEQISSGMQATKVVTLVRIDPLRLSLTVPQQEVGRIRLGQTVRFRVDSFPGRDFEGKVRFISPVVAHDTRSMVVEAVVPNPKAELYPGLFAIADLELPRQEPSMLVPLSAVVKTGEVGRVFVVRDGIAREQIVAIGDTSDGKFEILSGLKGNEIVVANPDLVRDGDAIRP